MHGALKEVEIPHKFVYGSPDNVQDVAKITRYCLAAGVKNCLNMAMIGAFGGRGMGQTCGFADPSQWMKYFGVDIDSRDTTRLIKTAESITPDKLD